MDVRIKVLTACAPLLLVAACGQAGGGGERSVSVFDGQGDLNVRPVEGDSLIPVDGIEQWALSGDHLVTFEVVGDSRQDVDPLIIAESGSAYAGRETRLEVRDVHWSRDGAPAAPDVLTAVWDGWIVETEDVALYQIGGAPMLEVGGTYLGVAVLLEEGDLSSWKILPETATALVEGEIADPAAVASRAEQPFRTAAEEFDVPDEVHVGDDGEAVAQELSDVETPEWAEELMHLPGLERAEAIGIEELVQAAPEEYRDQIREQYQTP